MACSIKCFGLLLFSNSHLLSQYGKSLLLVWIVIWFLESIWVRYNRRLRVVLFPVCSIILGTHGSCVPIRRAESKLHSPFPVWDALVLVPPYGPVASNLFQLNLSFMIRFFRRCVIAHLESNG